MLTVQSGLYRIVKSRIAVKASANDIHDDLLRQFEPVSCTSDAVALQNPSSSYIGLFFGSLRMREAYISRNDIRNNVSTAQQASL